MNVVARMTAWRRHWRSPANVSGVDSRAPYRKNNMPMVTSETLLSTSSATPVAGTNDASSAAASRATMKGSIRVRTARH